MKANTRIFAARQFIAGNGVETVARALHVRKSRPNSPCRESCKCDVTYEVRQVESAIRFTLRNVKAAFAEGRFVARAKEGAAT